MARRTQTYAIRLAVEGGGQVKAELITVGQSGEQSLKRIETAGGRASGGLKGLGRQAELLRTGIRTLGGALAGVATVGGLGVLIDRSISAADAIGKTADKIGVGVEALQELRFAAKASGVEQQTLPSRQPVGEIRLEPRWAVRWLVVRARATSATAQVVASFKRQSKTSPSIRSNCCSFIASRGAAKPMRWLITARSEPPKSSRYPRNKLDTTS